MRKEKHVLEISARILIEIFLTKGKMLLIMIGLINRDIFTLATEIISCLDVCHWKLDVHHGFIGKQVKNTQIQQNIQWTWQPLQLIKSDLILETKFWTVQVQPGFSLFDILYFVSSPVFDKNSNEMTLYIKRIITRRFIPQYLETY